MPSPAHPLVPHPPHPIHILSLFSELHTPGSRCQVYVIYPDVLQAPQTPASKVWHVISPCSSYTPTPTTTTHTHSFWSAHTAPLSLVTCSNPPHLPPCCPCHHCSPDPHKGLPTWTPVPLRATPKSFYTKQSESTFQNQSDCPHLLPAAESFLFSLGQTVTTAQRWGHLPLPPPPPSLLNQSQAGLSQFTTDTMPPPNLRAPAHAHSLG